LSKYDEYKKQKRARKEKDSLEGGHSKDRKSTRGGRHLKGLRGYDSDSDSDDEERFTSCNPEKYGGWKTYQELSEVTLFHEDC